MSELREVEWEKTGTETYVPMWEEHIEENAVLLTGLTPAMLPDLLRKSSDLASKKLSAEEWQQRCEEAGIADLNLWELATQAR